MILLLTEPLLARSEQNQHFISYSNAEIYVYNIQSRGRYLTGSSARILGLGSIQLRIKEMVNTNFLHQNMHADDAELLTAQVFNVM